MTHNRTTLMAKFALGALASIAACAAKDTVSTSPHVSAPYENVATLSIPSNQRFDLSVERDAGLSEKQAVATQKFLDSIGVNTTFPDRGQPIEKTIDMVNYVGFRWIRAGIEGLSDTGPTTINTYLELHRRTGVKLSMGLMSGSSDISKLLHNARILADADALLAIEGNNEPNNWPVTHEGKQGGGNMSWLPVARLQRDLYRAIKSDSDLADYPVWSLSAGGAQQDNVGLQFLKIPNGAGTLMPDGTRYADVANLHNYFYHPSSSNAADNKTWDAADPTSAAKVDGLYKNYGRTWLRGFSGYQQEKLERIPRVTTETGTTINEIVTEEMQAKHLVNVYLAQFKRNFSHTAVYILRDRTDERGNQTFGFFRPDFTPRKAATYLHNLTTILADEGATNNPAKLAYALENMPETAHSLLLQASDGRFQLIVWNERAEGPDAITVRFRDRHTLLEIYDPIEGPAPMRQCRNCDEVLLELSDHPNVIIISI